mgnify:CR=1 FL=1
MVVKREKKDSVQEPGAGSRIEDAGKEESAISHSHLTDSLRLPFPGGTGHAASHRVSPLTAHTPAYRTLDAVRQCAVWIPVSLRVSRVLLRYVRHGPSGNVFIVNNTTLSRTAH